MSVGGHDVGPACSAVLALKRTPVHIIKTTADPFSCSLLRFRGLLNFGRKLSAEIAAACSFCSSDLGVKMPSSLADREMQWGVFGRGRISTCHVSLCAQLQQDSRSPQNKMFGNCCKPQAVNQASLVRWLHTRAQRLL